MKWWRQLPATPGRGNADRPASPIEISSADSNEESMQEVSDEIKIQIKHIQVDESPIEMKGEGPKILIYHSHTREAYRQNPEDPYAEASAEAFRTDGMNYSVVRIRELHWLKPFQTGELQFA